MQFRKPVRQFIAQMIFIGSLAQAIGLVATPAWARDVGSPEAGIENETPQQLEGVGITEHLGDHVNLDLNFRNEQGEVVPLRTYFKDHKPVLLTMAYYSCPSLCNFHLNGLNDAFKKMSSPIGSEFNVVVVSIEPKETPELASAKKASYIKAYGRPEGAAGWHFLVGDEPQIRELAKQVGFGYRWDEEQKQWAHAAAAYVLTPEGRISRYLYGIDFDPKTVRLSLVEASNGRIGTLVDKLILYCFHFDPKASKYTLYAFNVMRSGSVLVVIVLAIFLAPFWFRNRREEKRVQGEA